MTPTVPPGRFGSGIPLEPVRIVILAVMLGAAACGPATATPPVATPPAPSPTAPPATPAATLAPTPTASAASQATATASAGPTRPATTMTEWGLIWDDVPSRFPRMLASEPTETSAGPASAVLVVPARTREAADWYGAALPAAGYPIEGTSGPYEDGGYVIDATGPVRACRVQVSLARMGTATIATILFGAACPFR